MTKIVVPPELLFRVANEFHTASIQLEWTINLLNQQISTMLVWDGTTRQRFFDDFHRARNEMTLTIEHIRAISDELKRIANKFILVDEELQPLLSVRSSREESEPETWQDHVEEFGQGIKSGAMGIGESIVDTGKALFEDPLGTMGQMAYNATIGFAEEVSDTAIWGAKMAFDVGDTRNKFGETINESGGMANYLGEQGVMLAGGALLSRVGVKNNPALKHDSGGDGGGAFKKDEGMGKGVGSAYDHVYKSTRPVEEVFPELRDINPHYVEGAGPGVNTNCTSCANATHSRLSGVDSEAIAQNMDGYGYHNDLLPSSPWGFEKPATVSEVIEIVAKKGDGFTAPVVIHQGNILHVINVFNKNGEVNFIDSQIGKIVELDTKLILELGKPN